VVSLSERYAAQIRRLYAASAATRWNVSLETFTQAVDTGIERRFAGETPGGREVAAYLASLAGADLALACACRLGHEAAWDHFVTEFRPVLYAAGRAIAGEAGRELADSVYADLFGTSTDRPDRRSLFAYYHGRSSLATWLRAVLARRHVDRLRETARTEPLAEDDHFPPSRPSSVTEPVDPGRARYVRLAQEAIDAAIAALPGGDRLRLRLYYGEGLTLAEIGRVVHEHEATVSRKLSRLKRELRDGVVRTLKTVHGMDDASVAACFDHAADAPELQLTRLLSSAEDG
jgi:RNA polymerase sigma-70 factor